MPYLMGLEQKIFYTKQGHGKPPTLLLIHGASGSHLDWPTEIRRLEDTVVYSIDLPGHGRSVGLGRNNIVAYSNEVIQLINSLNLEKVVVAGYSMGGAIAQEIGLRKLQQVSGLVLISTGVRLRVAESILELLMTDYSNAADLLVRLSWSPDAPEALLTRAKERLLDIDQDVALGDYTACDTFDLMEEIDTIDLPALVISGSADRMTPPKYCRFLSERLPNSRLVQVEGGGHMVFLEQPAVVADLISTFLEELRR